MCSEIGLYLTLLVRFSTKLRKRASRRGISSRSETSTTEGRVEEEGEEEEDKELGTGGEHLDGGSLVLMVTELQSRSDAKNPEPSVT